MASRTFTARWLLPIDGPPLAGGLLTIDGEKIVAVEPAGTRFADVDLGDVAVLPGLVNAHVHLDLSGMRGLAPPRLRLPDWLRQVIGHRLSVSPGQVAQDIHAGLAECIRTGTTLVGDISGDGRSWEILQASPIRAVVFRELLGLSGDRLRAAAQTALTWGRDCQPTPTCRPGYSPHAPYSVSERLLHMVTSQAWQPALPLAAHLGESAEELELLASHRGPFVPFLQGLGVWDPEALGSLRDWTHRLNVADRVPVLLAHGNYLQPRDVPPGATVVICPRTHAAFGHPPHPLPRFLEAGIRVAVGTDGLASNPDLDLLAELRWLRRTTELPGAVILAMGTRAGAEALGFGQETGSLTPGKSADWIVVPLKGASHDDPHDQLLHGHLPAQRVMCQGRWLLGEI
ncbi:MAG: amidohydrolase family protein [Gemmataceae bacterium]